MIITGNADNPIIDICSYFSSCCFPVKEWKRCVRQPGRGEGSRECERGRAWMSYLCTATIRAVDLALWLSVARFGLSAGDLWRNAAKSRATLSFLLRSTVGATVHRNAADSNQWQFIIVSRRVDQSVRSRFPTHPSLIGRWWKKTNASVHCQRFFCTYLLHIECLITCVSNPAVRSAANNAHLNKL